MDGGRTTSSNGISRNAPCVSVVVPVYNAASRLDETISMLRKQSLVDCELIFVDDGSVDGSDEIVLGYSEEDSRIRYLPQNHSGAGSARNRGMDAARGEYLIFLDADDIYSSQILGKLAAALEIDGSDIALCEMDSIDMRTGATKPRVRFPEMYPGGAYEPSDFGSDFFKVCTNNPVNKMFRRDFLKRLGLKYQSLQNTNDLFFVCAACSSASRLSLVKESLYTYRLSQGRSIQDAYLKSPFCTFIALYTLHSWLVEQGRYQGFISSSFKSLAMGNANASLRKCAPDKGLFREVCLQFTRAMNERWGFPGDGAGLSAAQRYAFRCMMGSSAEALRQALLPLAGERFYSSKTKVEAAARMFVQLASSKIRRELCVSDDCANAVVDVESVTKDLAIEDWSDALDAAFEAAFALRANMSGAGCPKTNPS